MDAEVAVDLTAETFAVALRSWRTLRPLGPEQRRAWLFTVGRRLHARYVRRARVERRAVERLGIQIPSLHSDDLALIEERCGLGELRAALGVELGRLARRGTAHRQGPGGQLRRQDSRSAPPSWDDGPACVELRAGLPRRAAGTSRAEPQGAAKRRRGQGIRMSLLSPAIRLSSSVRSDSLTGVTIDQCLPTGQR
jgi:hypothetical protein